MVNSYDIYLQVDKNWPWIDNVRNVVQVVNTYNPSICLVSKWLNNKIKTYFLSIAPIEKYILFMLWGILINTMRFRIDFNNNDDTRTRDEKSNRIFVISFVLALAFGFLYTHQIPIAISQSVNDQNLNVEVFVEGLDSPTSMAFLDKNSILVLEKNGQVRLVSNDQLQPQPVLEIPVDFQNERGLLGIAVQENTESDNNSGQASNTKNIFLYYTGVDQDSDELKNLVYKYTWNGQALENPTLMLDLPAIPGPNHDGGKLMIGPDNHLYGIIGDLNHDGMLQNFPDGPNPDDSGIIFRISTVDGSPPADNPFSSDPNDPRSKYFAYGIRNSFGLTFDPVTKTIWETENGPASNDEINIVNPGFNSGWQTIMGPISSSGNTESDLVSFEGSHYADPVLTWLDPPALTDIEFLNSTSLGESYYNNVFVSDYNNGNLYYFEMNPERNGFVLDTIPDLIVDNDEEQDSIIFGSGFGSITDLVTGPDDGYLYILSYDNGVIYRITPASGV
ncbi:PQQ-dependent sugar dehydrogenase [Candidatus Nitrosocosmicus franklandus]|uniref:Quinoprotein glucose/ sorbosone dehydrogenase (Modular protein) n=1 Tax=Candidatus Nitrosocosmicus franklandianus TaxID=1798806 RepID=A0A484IBA9_9ARCH|nr:PQQ-dependent sugar dehydrogenase [Candidatus Nitrosocosmicus franklandus]VFJ13517.1 Putative quinoprotein glucose/ sorbosone dehydrogenase (modular protein) [Candidatus Nitrosocosmicus franklandus]